MGHSVSEPATSADLGHSVRAAHVGDNGKKRAGWHFPRLSFQQLVTAAIHVDDMVVCSKALCESCLFDGIVRIVPKDIGLSLEERGAVIRFLHSEIYFDLQGNAVICPYQPNLPYALGLCDNPRFARIPHYEARVHSRCHLLPAALARLHSSNALLLGNDNLDAVRAILGAVLEMLRLEWPVVWVVHALSTAGTGHGTAFFRRCRRLARGLLRIARRQPRQRVLHALVSHMPEAPWIRLDDRSACQ